MSPERIEFLKERLATRIRSLEIHERNESISSTQKETLDAFRIALGMLLAGMDSEPVYQVLSGDAWVDVSYGAMCSQKRVGATVRTLYAAPPVPVVVPDEMTPKQASRAYCGEVRGYRDGWNACRAAMLQGADGTLIGEGTRNHPEDKLAMVDHSGDSNNMVVPVTAATVPDGWKLVPVEPTEAMLDAAYSYPASTEDRMRKQYASMLAAAPAAPEREV